MHAAQAHGRQEWINPVFIYQPPLQDHALLSVSPVPRTFLAIREALQISELIHFYGLGYSSTRISMDLKSQGSNPGSYWQIL